MKRTEVYRVKLGFEKAGYRVRVVSPYQLKSGRVSYWPTKGTIMIDGSPKSYRDIDFEAALIFLERYGTKIQSIDDIVAEIEAAAIG